MLVRDVYPGIDARYYGRDGRLEYDLIVAPGASPAPIGLEFDGVDGTSMRGADVVLSVRGREMVLRQPVTYQEISGQRVLVASRYEQRGRRVSLRLGAYDHTRPLVIDPTFDYATFLGGSGLDQPWAIAIDGDGSAYITGYTESAAFGNPTPVAPALIGTPAVPNIVPFVAKLDPTGSTLLFFAYVGGSHNDFANQIAVDAAHNIYVGGESESLNFPTPGGFQTVGKGDDGFLFKLDANGSLVYGTYMGGDNVDIVYGVAVDGSGHAFVSGQTASSVTPPQFINDPVHRFDYFPVTPGAFQTVQNGLSAFVMNIDTNAFGPASLVYSTLFSGPQGAYGNKIAIDAAGNAYLQGDTPFQIPIVNGFQPLHAGGGGNDSYLAKFDPSGSQLLYSTLIGGTGPEDDGNRNGGVAVDNQGNAYVVGTTRTLDFPTTPGAIKAVLTGPGTFARNAFIVKIDTNASGAASEVYGTLIGGFGQSDAVGVAVDGIGNAYVTGWTNQTSDPEKFPTTACAVQPVSAAAGSQDAFLARVNSTGTALVYSTLIAGNGGDFGRGVAVDATGHAFVTGNTDSTSFPVTPGAFQPLTSSPCPGCGFSHGFVVKIDTATCSADLHLVKAASAPIVQIGTNFTYTLDVTNSGPLDATNVVISDPLPGNAQFVSAQVTAGTGTCSNAGQLLTCTFPSIANGGEATVQIVATATNPDIKKIFNTATVTLDQTDPNPNDNTSTVVTNTSVGKADVSIAKVATPDPVAVGQLLTYTLTVVNNGPDPAESVSVVDQLPPNVSFNSVFPSAGSCSPGPTVTCTLGDMTAGQIVTIQIFANPLTTGVAHNTATVQTPTLDPDLSNNSATANPTIDLSADVSIVKTGPTSAFNGTPVQYSLSATNSGPSSATNVTITDTLPSNVSFVSALGLPCNTAGQIVTCTVGNLAAGANASVTINTHANQVGLATNTAVVSANEPDPAPANNTSSIFTGIAGVSDLAIVKTGPLTAANHSAIAYQLTATNNGPSPSSNVVITDTLPSQVSFISALGLSCNAAGQVITCQAGNLAVNAHASVTITTTANVPGLAVNTAVVSATEADPTPVNNTASASTTIGGVADVSVVKTASDPQPLLGATFTYTLFVHNAGPDAASNVKVTDSLPAGVQLVSAPPSCVGTPLVCQVGSLPFGGNVSIQITVKATAVGAIANTATVKATEGDPAPANNTSTANVTVKANADLSITITATPNPVIVNNDFEYTMTTKNNGPSTATSVTSTLHFLASTGSVGSAGIVIPNNCVGSGIPPHVQVACTYPSIASGQSRVSQFVLKATGIGLVNTSATTTSPVFDPNTANNTATNVEGIKKPLLIILANVITREIAVGAIPAPAGASLTELVTTATRLFDAGDVVAGTVLLNDVFVPEVDLLVLFRRISVDTGNELKAAVQQAFTQPPTVPTTDRS